MNKKQILIFGSVSILLILITTIAAAWYFEYDREVNGEIIATGKELNLIIDLSDFSINTSTGILNNSQDLVINNKKDPRMVTFLISVNKTLTEPMCPNFTDDCTVEFKNETDIIISNGTSYIIPKGLLNYTLDTGCVEYSCGQNISIHVEIKE